MTDSATRSEASTAAASARESDERNAPTTPLRNARGPHRPDRGRDQICRLVDRCQTSALRQVVLERLEGRMQALVERDHVAADPARDVHDGRGTRRRAHDEAWVGVALAHLGDVAEPE